MGVEDVWAATVGDKNNASAFRKKQAANVSANRRGTQGGYAHQWTVSKDKRKHAALIVCEYESYVGDIGERCSGSKSCPFPAIIAGFCRQHWYDIFLYMNLFKPYSGSSWRRAKVKPIKVDDLQNIARDFKKAEKVAKRIRVIAKAKAIPEKEAGEIVRQAYRKKWEVPAWAKGAPEKMNVFDCARDQWWCMECKTELPTHSFHLVQGSRGRFNRICKECIAAINKKVRGIRPEAA